MTSNNETFKEVHERVNNKISEIQAFILETTLMIETMIDPSINKNDISYELTPEFCQPNKLLKYKSTVADKFANGPQNFGNDIVRRLGDWENSLLPYVRVNTISAYRQQERKRLDDVEATAKEEQRRLKEQADKAQKLMQVKKIAGALNVDISGVSQLQVTDPKEVKKIIDIKADYKQTATIEEISDQIPEEKDYNDVVENQANTSENDSQLTQEELEEFRQYKAFLKFKQNKTTARKNEVPELEANKRSKSSQ